ncbi:MAG: D-tyrosyl-tRNA(Tyr) deacylase [Candidatus Latescibacteria bacterium]|nr:D-tyrosyl-tRNA(Tyr) deacylase [Candidatus Latescibacterota bacterium]
MIGLIQRVDKCSVSVEGSVISSIGEGLLILLGVHRDDTEKDLYLLARKCTGLRIFSDDEGKMNLSINDINGEILVVSQFTLFGDVKRGLRPYFGEAAEPEKAEKYYETFMAILTESGIPVKGGVFGAHMHLDILNNGPVTVSINTKDL